MQRTRQFVKSVAHQAAAGISFMLVGASPLFAQSDTTEVRPSDVRPAAANAQSSSDFSERKEEVKANIELWEARVRKKLEQIEQILKGLDLKKIEGQKIAVSAIDELLEEVDQEAKGIIDAHTRIGPDLKLYRQALLNAPDVFRKIAEQMESRASTKKSAILKEAYADIATEARKLAVTYEAKAKTIDGLEIDIARKMEFVHESRVFIADVREYLSAIPNQNGLQTEKLVQRINQYIEVFQEAIKSIKGVSDKIGDGPQPTTPDPTKTKSTPLTRANNANAPISIDAYRQGLADLKR